MAAGLKIKGHREEGEGLAGGLYRLGNLVLCAVGGIIFLALSWYSFRYTQYIVPGQAERSLDRADSMGLNLAVLVIAAAGIGLLTFLERRLDKKRQLLLCRVSAGMMMVWIAAASVWWVYSSEHVPVGDQAFIYGGASYFMEGKYFFLDKGGYCDMYPYQLGLIALCELLFQLAGPLNYRAFELVCVALAVGSAWCGYRILREIMGDTAVIAGYNILMAGCLPLIFYTPWVYGDIPSIFFAMLAQWMLLRYCAERRKRWLAVMVFSLVLAMLVRKNSAILLAAVCIGAILYALRYRDRRVMTAFLLAAALAWGAYGAVYKMYEIRSGYEHSQGTPFVVWLAMGVEETKGTFGWDNNYYKEVFYESGCDMEATAEAAREILAGRLEEFRRNPSMALVFYRNKVLSQWNQPLYQALFFNAESPEKEGGPEHGSLAAGLGGAYYENVLAVCDRWQCVIYVGMLCYFILAVKRDSNILQHILAITIVGGFFYSIISEGKARYIFPYYVMMFPFALYGYRQAAEVILRFRHKGKAA